MVGHRFIAFGLGALLVACAGCSDRNPHATIDNATSSPANATLDSAARSVARETGANTAHPLARGAADGLPGPRRDIVDRLLEPVGRRSLSADFRGDGSKNTIFYGKFSRNIGASSPDYLIGDALLLGEKIKPISKGDYGIVIVPSNPADRLILFVTYEAPIFKIVEPADELSYCWKPRGKEKAVSVGSEDGGGIVHYRNGWKWAICGD